MRGKIARGSIEDIRIDEDEAVEEINDQEPSARMNQRGLSNASSMGLPRDSKGKSKARGIETGYVMDSIPMGAAATLVWKKSISEATAIPSRPDPPPHLGPRPVKQRQASPFSPDLPLFPHLPLVPPPEHLVRKGTLHTAVPNNVPSVILNPLLETMTPEMVLPGVQEDDREHILRSYLTDVIVHHDSNHFEPLEPLSVKNIPHGFAVVKGSKESKMVMGKEIDDNTRWIINYEDMHMTKITKGQRWHSRNAIWYDMSETIRKEFPPPLHYTRLNSGRDAGLPTVASRASSPTPPSPEFAPKVRSFVLRSPFTHLLTSFYREWTQDQSVAPQRPVCISFCVR